MLERLASRKTLTVAGLMSGTSADGVDAAIVQIGPRGLKVLAFGMFPYKPALRRNIFRLFDPATSRVDEICHMDFVLGEVFAQAVIRLARTSGIPLRSIDLIGSHGQTIWHDPAGRAWRGRRLRSTLQIGQPSIIAQRTGITTVADFRPRDIAAGGQGAPLVPYADLVLLGHPSRARAIQNIGGIANVTYLPALGGPASRDRRGAGGKKAGPWLPANFQLTDSAIRRVRAFDTGPGNMVIDCMVWLVSGGRKTFDRGGALAAKGRVNQRLLAELLCHQYFSRRPPKTTGREMFGAQFTDALYRRCTRRGLAPLDMLATATMLTARSIAQAYRRFLPGMPDEVILCGGGARNGTLLAMLHDELAPATVAVMDDLGFDADAKEAISFAILAEATIRGRASNVPSATGAARRAVLGKIVPGC